MNGLMDTLTPQTIVPTGARKVLQMTKRDDAEDLRKQAELEAAMDLAKFLKVKARQELSEVKRNEQIRALRIRRKKEAVRKAKLKWEQAVKELEEVLSA